MPIPNLLVGPSLLGVAAAGDPAVETDRYAASAQDALARLGAQRRALLSQQVPRLIALWEGLGATSASETYGDTLTLLTGSERAATAEAIRDEVVVPLSPPANDDGKHALVEVIRLQAVERASSAGLDGLARARIRLSGMARRIETRGADATPTTPFQRLLEGSALLAAAAAAAAGQPLLGQDGGVDRRFMAALRHLQS